MICDISRSVRSPWPVNSAEAALPPVPRKSTALVPAGTLAGMGKVPDSTPWAFATRVPPGSGSGSTATPSNVTDCSVSPGPKFRSKRTSIWRRYSSGDVVWLRTLASSMPAVDANQLIATLVGRPQVSYTSVQRSTAGVSVTGRGSGSNAL